MILIPILALIIGIIVGRLLAAPVDSMAGTYLGVVVIAGLDTIFGGTKSVLRGRFRSDLFLSGFAANIVFAFFLAWLGDYIGINLVLAAAVFFGMRILNNLSVIRRELLPNARPERARREDGAVEFADAPVEEV